MTEEEMDQLSAWLIPHIEAKAQADAEAEVGEAINNLALSSIAISLKRIADRLELCSDSETRRFGVNMEETVDVRNHYQS